MAKRLERALTSTWFIIFITNGFHAVSKHMWHLLISTGYSFAYQPLPNPHGATARSGPRPPHYRSFTITLRHTTLSRTPLDKWSTQNRDLYLTTQHSQQTNILAPSGISTRNPTKQAATDPRLRPRGHQNQLHLQYFCKIYHGQKCTQKLNKISIRCQQCQEKITVHRRVDNFLITYSLLGKNKIWRPVYFSWEMHGLHEVGM